MTTFDFGVTRTDAGSSVEVLAVRGEVDIFTAPELKRAAREAVGKGTTRIVLDLTETTFLDSTGLGVIIGLSKLVRPAGGDIAIVNTDSGIARTFEITGLSDIITVRDSRDDAVAAVAGDGA